MALSSATQEAIWLKQFGAELDEDWNKTVNIYCDNQSAVKIAESDNYRPRSKHIDVRHHYLKERIQDGTISIQRIPTNEMVADNLTKGVTKDKHSFCTKSMGLC